MNKPGETIMNKMPKPINDDKLNSPEEAKRYFSLHDTDKMLDWLERGVEIGIDNTEPDDKDDQEKE